MASEATKQEELLRSGLLDKLGFSKPNKPIEFIGLEEVLYKYAGLLLEGFAEELNRDRLRGGNPPYIGQATGSGKLLDSMRFEVKKFSKTYEMSIHMADHWKFTEEGVQGVDSSKSVNTLSPYKFKFINPSKKHVEKLEQWVKDKNVTSIITVPKGIAHGNEAKTLAYIFARSIKIRGLRATYFKKKTIERLIDEMKFEIAKAVGIDIKVNILF